MTNLKAVAASLKALAVTVTGAIYAFLLPWKQLGTDIRPCTAVLSDWLARISKSW